MYISDRFESFDAFPYGKIMPHGIINIIVMVI